MSLGRLRFWLLALALFGAQLLLAVHSVEHGLDAEAADGPCPECLALAGTHGAPPPVPALSPAPAAAHPASSIAVPTRLTFTPWPPFHSRAPPLHG